MSSRHPWQRQVIVGLLPLTLGFGILAAVVFVPRALKGNADFRQFYAGGYMMRTGLRHSLYDTSTQKIAESSFVSPSSQLLPMIHPAYEYIFFSPLSALSYSRAYMVWFVVNVFALAYCGTRIARWVHDSWLTLALVGGFAPVLATLMHGQDSMWLLLLCVLSLESRDDFAAGAVLGLTAFRFHLLVPILILYVLWKKWRFVYASLVTAGCLAVISLWLVGIKGSLLYVRSAVPSTDVRQGFSVNAYGIAQTLLGPQHAHAAMFIAGACALIALWYAARQKPSLDLALLVIPVASYYLMFHDLIILLIPVSRRIRESSAAVLQYVFPIIGFTPLAFLSAAPSIGMLFAKQAQEPASSLESPNLERAGA